MKLRMLFSFTAALVVALISSTVAQEAITDQAKCFTTWDEHYFYLSCRVDSPDVRGTHKAPNAEILGDDSITLYVETDNKRAEQVGAACFSMAVSAAGGSQFSAGRDGELAPTSIWTFKYGTNVLGTINNSDDIDMGYVVEMAIPWDAMGVTKPSTGDMFGFNVVVRRHGAQGTEFVSLSPNVKTEEDILCPAKWSRLVFALFSFGVATTSAEKIVSAKYMVRAPLINGSISDKEWHANTSFAMDLPMPPGVVYEAKFPAQRMVLSSYVFRRDASAGNEENTGRQLVNYPIRNVGPWSRSDRTQYHKDELSDMVAAGIDVVLPHYSQSRDAMALMCLVNAIDELRVEGRPHPLVGMYGLPPLDGSPQDIQAITYQTIADFFSRVPEEYRAVAQAGKPRNGLPGVVVVVDQISPELADYCAVRFEKDFGCPIIFTGGDDGHVRVGDVSPGLCLADSGPGNSIISRLGGDTYEKSWAAVLDKNSSWVVCHTWNDLSSGNGICATREYGRTYIDATKANINRFTGNRDFHARYLRYNLPKVIPAKQFGMAELTIRNAGNSPWRVSEGYALGYRWYRGGRYFGESKVRRPLERDVQPGETVTINIGIATVDQQGGAMPEGPCEVRIELIRMADNKWFSTLGDQPLILPLVIGAPMEWQPSYLSCRASTMMAAGQKYPAVVRVRNDGSRIWKKGVTKLGCKLYKVSNYTHNVQESVENVPIRDCRALLAKDCKPGEVAEFVLEVDLTQPNKKPVPVWTQSEPWSYQLRFDIYNGQDWLSEIGIGTLNRAVAIFENDFGPRIVDCDITSKLMAGQTVDVKVVVRNNGAVTWDKKRAKIGYHWYHLDGTEMLWDGMPTPITQNLQPGWPVIVTAKVKAPDYDGQYVLVWDVMIDDVWQSTQPLSRGGDILPVFVEVTGGKLAFADLGGVYDTVAFSPDTDRTTGDFDGKGSSFPAELAPPDAGVTEEARRVYPSGYRLGGMREPDGRISFYYPEKTTGSSNAVACNGQNVIVENNNYTALHILGASSSGTAAGDISLNYASGEQSAKLEMSDWSGEPSYSEKIALMTPHRHSHGGDEIGKTCRLYHYTIPLDPAKTLTSITLPNNVNMKVVAATLERVKMPTFLPPAVAEGEK